MKYRKKPVVIEAEQFTGNNAHLIYFWSGGAVGYEPNFAENMPPDKLTIKTLEGDMTATPGDFIIKGVNGEFYPCKPDIFAKTYEPVEDAASFDAALRGTVGPQSFSDRTPDPRGAEVTD
jgi:hypothetical protein